MIAPYFDGNIMITGILVGAPIHHLQPHQIQHLTPDHALWVNIRDR